jgi:hypothetical protein
MFLGKFSNNLKGRFAETASRNLLAEGFLEGQLHPLFGGGED